MAVVKVGVIAMSHEDVYVISPIGMDKSALLYCKKSVEAQEYPVKWVPVPDDMDNPTGALAGFYNAAMEITNPDAIIVTLDGDDWFIRPDAIDRIVQEYQSPSCWMTYGSWVSNKNGYPALLPGYDKGTTMFRKMPWLCTQVRTCRKWLMDKVDPDTLIDLETGKFWRWPSDMPLWLPMLEMSTTAHAVHIPEALMMYNRSSAYAMPVESMEERNRNREKIFFMPVYQPLSR